MEVKGKNHLEKTRIGKKQQSAFAEELDKLDAVLQKLKVKHPFDWDPQLYNHLLNASSHFKTGATTNTKLQLEESCLYRYTTFNRLIKNKNLKWHNKAVNRNLAFNVLCERIESGDIYEFKLSDFMNGSYKNGRGFSWWTKQKIESIEDVFRLGIPSDWIAEQSIVMKVKDEHIIQQQKIPSVIDAYDSPVFYPVKLDDKKAKGGKTLNLNDVATFEGGCDEYVTGGIAADKIFITPYNFNITEKEVFLKNILTNLLEFYKTK